MVAKPARIVVQGRRLSELQLAALRRIAVATDACPVGSGTPTHTATARSLARAQLITISRVRRARAYHEVAWITQGGREILGITGAPAPGLGELEARRRVLLAALDPTPTEALRVAALAWAQQLDTGGDPRAAWVVRGATMEWHRPNGRRSASAVGLRVAGLTRHPAQLIFVAADPEVLAQLPRGFAHTPCEGVQINVTGNTVTIVVNLGPEPDARVLPSKRV